MGERRKRGSSGAREFFFKANVMLYALLLCVIFPASGRAAAPPRIATGYDHAAAILSDGSLWTWGANHYGQIGDGTALDRLSPFPMGTGAQWKDIAAGKFYTLAVRSDGTLWAWGSNSYGQLGDGTATDRHAPVQIGTDSDWASVAAGTVHALALKTNGTLWAWGRNSAGQLGDGTKTDRSAPVQVGTDAAWIAVSAGNSHSLALKSDGTLWSWGANDQGQLGDGTTIQRSVPAQVGTDADWASLDGGDKRTHAIRSGGSLWAWGEDLGLLPLRIGLDSDWASISARTDHAIGVKTDGTLRAWGENDHGQLGDGTIIYAPLPVPVGAGTEWKTAIAGEDHTIVLAADGGVWTWGSNTYGQLGDGTHTGRLLPAPVQVQTITTVAGANGSISPSTPQSAGWGALVPFTVAPDSGFRIESADGCQGTLTGTTFTTGPTTEDCAVTAAFTLHTHTITATAGVHGSIAPSGDIVVADGSSQSFTCTPEPGYHVEAVLLDGTFVGPFRPMVIGIPLGDPFTYTLSNITASHTISASFAPNPAVTITAAAGPNGSISPSGQVTFLGETDKTFMIAPASGYLIADVLVDGVSVGAVSSYTFTRVMTNHTISASFRAANTYIIEASAGLNGTISPFGMIAALEGSSKSFTIRPATGYRTTSLVVDGVSEPTTSSVYTFTNVAAPHTISVSFSPTITATTSPNGTVSPGGTTVVTSGSDLTYTITPLPGYHVADVLVDGVSAGLGVTEPPLSRPVTYTFTAVTTPHTIKAVFVANPAVTITATAGAGGTITPSGEVAVLTETNKSFTIRPATGYRTTSLVVDGVSEPTTSSVYTFTNVAAPHTISVSFSPTIVASASAGGAISPAGTTVLTSGSNITYTITPLPGYHVTDVLVDGVSAGAVNSYTFTAVMAPHTIKAIFAAD